MIPIEDIEPGYYWVKPGIYAPMIVQVLWQLQPRFYAMKVGAYAKGGRRREHSEYQDLMMIMTGLTDRIRVDSGYFTFLQRIEPPDASQG